ncbi:Clavaminate synthase-like protein [Auricularia subglabra TFB-10046 SS5]|uniref:Clavaminate synthase-like protein n=1 Tax=Auricularia subglabra (strain TFB-10046 / SS5) TaxID=717982 RepID=J0LEK9_AURST|nr:Clavaminate synthase-like protein [Auricularia subglabra TFB-10046 SS5]
MVSALTRPQSPTAVTTRPAKRARFDPSLADPEPAPRRERSSPPPSIASSHRPHPLGLKPSGNALIYPAKARKARVEGLGSLAVLPDELILDLLSLLPPRTVFRLQAVSRAFFAFSRQQAHWRVFYLSESGGKLLRWDGDWRRTFWAVFCASESAVKALYADNDDDREELDLVMPADGITAPDLCSDVLYQPHLCSASLAHHFEQPNALHNLRRADARTLDSAAFARNFAQPSTPVILTSLIDYWPCTRLQSDSSWDLGALAQRFADVAFRAEAAQVPMKVYARYCASIERGAGAVDESPLYLFDAEFVRRTGSAMGDEFEVPAIFGEDLFRIMGAQRPDHRWLIVGPSRAGSTWHKDPNSTSAWNAVITGAKGWVLFPPDIPPPGVFVSEDEAEVTAPLSLAEWFNNYSAHALATYGPNARDPATRGKMIQGVCRAGEVMYIPAGWWHIVVNLESCVAVTQNFVSETELPAVLRFMRDKPEQVSGFKLDAAQEEADDDDADAKCDVYARFCAALERDVPDIYARAQQGLAEDKAPTHARKDGGGGGGRGWWASVNGKSEQAAFSFGFGADGEDIELEDVPW